MVIIDYSQLKPAININFHTNIQHLLKNGKNKEEEEEDEEEN